MKVKDLKKLLEKYNDDMVCVCDSSCADLVSISEESIKVIRAVQETVYKNQYCSRIYPGDKAVKVLLIQ